VVFQRNTSTIGIASPALAHPTKPSKKYASDEIKEDELRDVSWVKSHTYSAEHLSR
jgi:hypothetical protein